MATTLLPPGLCLSGASWVRAYANYVTLNAIRTDYVLRRSHVCILDLFRFCSCYDLEHVFCVFWWLLSISGCLLFRPVSTLFLSLHYSTAASGTLKVIASRFIISSLFRSDFHLFFGVAFSQWWFEAFFSVWCSWCPSAVSSSHLFFVVSVAVALLEMVVSSVVRYCCTLCGLTVPPPLIAGFALECWSEASMYNLQVFYSFRRGVFSWSLLLLLVVRRTKYHVMKLKQNVVSSISHCGRSNNLVIWFPRSVSLLACFFMPLSQLCIATKLGITRFDLQRLAAGDSERAHLVFANWVDLQ